MGHQRLNGKPRRTIIAFLPPQKDLASSGCATTTRMFFSQTREFSLIGLCEELRKQLPFYAGKGDALDEVSLGNEENDDHRQQRND